MDNQSFDWLLHGCHVLSEVAVAYSPLPHTKIVIYNFRRILVKYSFLLIKKATVSQTSIGFQSLFHIFAPAFLLLNQPPYSIYQR